MNTTSICLALGLCASLGLAVLAPAACAQSLVGTSVTGSLGITGDPTNYFDPAIGYVPATGFENAAGTTVTISDTAIEFGFDDFSDFFSANFTGAALTLNLRSSLGSYPFTVQFTDAAFTGATLTTVADTFAGGTTATLTGDTLTITDTGTPAGPFSATFSIVPEPGSLALLAGMGTVGAPFLRRRKNARKAA